MIRLPSVTTGLVRGLDRRRAVLISFGALLALVVLALPRDPATAGPPPDLAVALGESSVALVLPDAWLAAPRPPLVANDRVDVLASSPDRSSGAALVASGARVLALQAEAVVLEVSPDDVAALVVSRARAYVLLLVLRPR